MSFAKSQQQPQKPNRQFQYQQFPKKHSKSKNNCSKTTAITTSTSTTTSFPTTYITAQNCFSNFQDTLGEKTKTQNNTKTIPESEQSTLMIKNLESSVTTATTTNIQPQAEGNEKKEEEEHEESKSTERRASVTLEFFSAQESKCEFNNKASNQPEPTEDNLKHCTETLVVPQQLQQQQQQPVTTTITTNNLNEANNTPAAEEVFSNASSNLNLTSTETSATSALSAAINNSNNSSNLSDLETNLAAAAATKTTATKTTRRTPSPVSGGGDVTASDSPTRRKDSTASKTGKIADSRNSLSTIASSRYDEADTLSKSSDTSGELARLQQSSSTQDTQSSTPPAGSSIADKCKSVSRLSERAKKKSWYNVLYPNYKSRAEDFKKLFKEVPNDERLIVDYSCALQRDILVQGRLYVSQNYVCFHANIFRWETYVCIKWKDVTSITKEKTALVIPNAISICTAKEKYFFATFATRDKAFLMLFRVWQNTLMNKQMLPQEMWQYVHNCYGDELGLTTDDEDYIDPTSVPIETEGELDFSSALEDTISINSDSQFMTAPLPLASDSNLTSFPISGIGSGNSSFGATIKSVLPPPPVAKKSKKSYFFSSNKSSSNSANATSGSDNKASDNNSGGGGGDFKKSKMKPYAKELTLITAEPDENTASSEMAVTATEKPANTSNNASNINSNSKEIKEPKSAATTASTSHDGKRKVSKNTRQRDETLSKNAEAIPTDMSDSSDSDENKIPFVVTAECTSTHEGRQLVHTILPINIETLFNLLFSKSKFLVDFHAMRKSADTNFPDWVTDEQGQKTRTVNVTVQLAASVGPKCSKVTEYQVLRDCSKPGELYSIDINSVNAGIPYADSFSVLMHYCLVRTVDDHTMLSVHAQIKYKKSIWGMVKGFIEKNTWAGLEDFYGALLSALQSETCIPPAKGKGRRPRRATSAQVRPSDENAISAVAQAKTEPAEHLLATNALHLPHAHTSTMQSLSGEASASKYKWLSLFVIVLLLFLIVVNVILLHKLWKLEERIEEDMSSRARMPNLASLKQLPNSHQEWMELLRQQEILHETELRKWHQILQTAIELLKKTEKTLAELMFR